MRSFLGDRLFNLEGQYIELRVLSNNNNLLGLVINVRVVRFLVFSDLSGVVELDQFTLISDSPQENLLGALELVTHHNGSSLHVNDREVVDASLEVVLEILSDKVVVHLLDSVVKSNLDNLDFGLLLLHAVVADEQPSAVQGEGDSLLLVGEVAHIGLEAGHKSTLVVVDEAL